MASSGSQASRSSTIRLERVVKILPRGLAIVRAEARTAGYRFLERLVTEWDTGVMRFDRPGEILLVAYSGKTLAGIGGITIDPVVPGALRMRRFYVRAAFRRTGIARTIAEALLASAKAAPLITVNAAPGSEQFWEALGFAREPSDGSAAALTEIRP